jgi:hypothetical protein
MLPGNALAPLFQVCTDIANEVADIDGFVPVRKLLERFQTRLRLRPLLVEGMIGSTSSAQTERPEWMVLVDSERYPDLEPRIHSESATNPLPARFRFTVAHELAHSLAFRTSEFGVFLEGISDKPENKTAIVQEIEKETDRLAPLLLCSEKVLISRLLELTGPIDLNFLTRLRRESGISRAVLLSRLALSRASDRIGIWQRPHLREFGLAIGDRTPVGTATLRRWPVFLNFGRGVPRAFLTLRERDRIPFEVALGQESLAALQSGTEVTACTRAGTPASMDADEMTVEISTEQTARPAASSFLTLVRNSRIRAEIERFEVTRLARLHKDESIGRR